MHVCILEGTNMHLRAIHVLPQGCTHACILQERKFTNQAVWYKADQNLTALGTLIIFKDLKKNVIGAAVSNIKEFLSFDMLNTSFFLSQNCSTV